MPGCSFHLRQLAKYGLAERVAGADGRERPWRASARTTSWDNVSDDPATQAAADHLNATILDHYIQWARRFLARRDTETREWRQVTGFGDTFVYVTAAELGELTRRIDELTAAFAQRRADPTTRPEGARAISLIQLALPLTGPSTDPPPDATAGAATGT